MRGISPLLPRSTYVKTEVPMLIEIPNPAINDDACSTDMMGARRHQPSPAGRIKPLWLLDIHDLPGLIVVCEVLFRLGRVIVAHFYHLDCDSWAEDLAWTGAVGGREHVDAIKEATIGILELCKRVPNL
jgi:hypothetical protein